MPRWFGINTEKEKAISWLWKIWLTVRKGLKDENNPMRWARLPEMRAERNRNLDGGKDAYNNPERGKAAASSENKIYVSAQSQMEVLTLSTGRTLGAVCGEMDVSHTNNRTDETERSNTGQGRSQRVGWCWGSGITPNAEMELTSAKIRHSGTGTGLDQEEGFSLDLLHALGETWTNNRKQKPHTHTADFCTGKALCAFSDEIKSSLGAREMAQVIEHLSDKHWDQSSDLQKSHEWLWNLACNSMVQKMEDGDAPGEYCLLGLAV